MNQNYSQGYKPCAKPSNASNCWLASVHEINHTMIKLINNNDRFKWLKQQVFDTMHFSIHNVCDVFIFLAVLNSYNLQHMTSFPSYHAIIWSSIFSNLYFKDEILYLGTIHIVNIAWMRGNTAFDLNPFRTILGKMKYSIYDDHMYLWEWYWNGTWNMKLWSDDQMNAHIKWLANYLYKWKNCVNFFNLKSVRSQFM